MYVGHTKLLFLVYEKNKVSNKDIEPHLWTYRQRISLEHLGQTLQEKALKEKYPILYEFLRVVSIGIRISLRKISLIVMTMNFSLF